jgi:hypothetical protein
LKSLCHYFIISIDNKILIYVYNNKIKIPAIENELAIARDNPLKCA